MDAVNLLILIAAFLLVTVVCWAVVILYCCIASSCSIPDKPEVLSSIGIYEDPISIIDLKKQAVQYRRGSISDNFCRMDTSFPSQVYFTPHYFRTSHHQLHHPVPPPLPCRNRYPLLPCNNLRCVQVEDVVYV